MPFSFSSPEMGRPPFPCIFSLLFWDIRDSSSFLRSNNLMDFEGRLFSSPFLGKRGERDLRSSLL